MNVTLLSVEQVPIADIVIGKRRREKLGRLESLQRSIVAHGLIHPILLRNGLELVAGERRLEACRRLEWKTIPARHVDSLSDEELRGIELDENTEREALNDYAASKARLASIRQAEAQAKTDAVKAADAESLISSGHTVPRTKPKKNKGGQKKTGSTRDVAKRTGIHPDVQRRTERHVALAEEFPFMQRKGWVQHSVLEAGETLKKMPAADQQAAAALLDQDAIPAKTAIQIIENLAEMPSADRKTVFAKAKSDDVMDRRTALTMAAKLPPPPDPGFELLGDASDILTRAAKQCRIQSYQARIKTLASEARNLYEETREYVKENRNNGVV